MLTKKCGFAAKIIKYTLLALIVGIIGFISAVYYYFPRNSVILRASGGIGNQLFNYAAAYSLAKANDKNLYLVVDPSTVKDNVKVTDRNHILMQFNIPKENIIYEDFILKHLLNFLNSSNIYKKNLLRKISPIIYAPESDFLSLKTQKTNKTFLLNGNFESEIFFADYKNDIRKMFDTEHFKSSKLDALLAQVTAKNSVCIHVRRRDFAEDKHMPIKFQQKAMLLAKELINDPHFYVFSDDIGQAKEELGNAANLTYVSNDNLLPLDDFVLLSNCANNINANSTFSWWASYLNKKGNNLVIDPHPRMSDYSINKIPCNNDCKYAWKALMQGHSAPANWVLLAYEQKPLNNEMLGIIPSPKYEELFKDYKPLPFYIYSGELAQLTLCKNGDFRQGLCFLNGANSKKPTVVTAYYQVPNKHSHQKYLHWAQNFLSIPFDLVVFTDKKNSGWIKKARGNLPIIIVEKELNKLSHYRFLNTYKRNAKQDANKSHSPELYTIWAEKVKFVNEAIDLNPYNADYFVWCDIGTFRDTKYIDHNFPNAKFINKERVTFNLLSNFTESERSDKLVDNSKTYRIQSNIQVGNVLAWRVYDELWDITRDYMMENGLSTVNDQRVISIIALRYPQIIDLLNIDPRFQGKPKWYSLLYYANSPNLLKIIDANYHLDDYDT